VYFRTLDGRVTVYALASSPKTTEPQMDDQGRHLASTLTEAESRRGIFMLPSLSNAAFSTVRNVPYAERYRGLNAVMETPAQHLQRTVGEESEPV
jgi:hypothetical protein